MKRPNHLIGTHGVGWILAHVSRRPLRVLTHCNTGSLATAAYGTALGVVRELHHRGVLDMVYVDETRPLLQGSRPTAWELAEDGIAHLVQPDAAAASTVLQGLVDVAVVGADRIAANADTANNNGQAISTRRSHDRCAVACSTSADGPPDLAPSVSGADAPPSPRELPAGSRPCALPRSTPRLPPAVRPAPPVAVPAAKVTSVQATPGWRPRIFWTRAAHDPHVIPPTVNSRVVAWTTVAPTSRPLPPPSPTPPRSRTKHLLVHLHRLSLSQWGFRFPQSTAHRVPKSGVPGESN
jgi:Initiation factor 2 subunit family